MKINFNTALSIILLILVIVMSYFLSREHSKNVAPEINPIPADLPAQVILLQNENDSLKNQILIISKEADLKDEKYENIISEYEIGMSYIKDYHPKAYQDFHRLIGMKERYSRELEKENSIRLKTK